MNDEQRKRKRGRRGGGKPRSEPAAPLEGTPSEAELGQQSAANDANPPQGETGQIGNARLRGSPQSVAKSSRQRPDSASPMDFWRSGRSRSHRERQPVATKGPRWWRGLLSLHVPPWMPVGLVIGVTFGILGLLFFVRGATGAPRIGDHWHAPYQVVICGERQPAMPEFEGVGSSPGTHGDAIIHLHPFSTVAEGSKNTLAGFFKTGGGTLSNSEIRSPGFSKTWKNGDKCEDGTEGTLQVFLNNEKLDDFTRYIPRDGDRLRIVFGALETSSVVEGDRTIIAEDQAERTLELEVTGAEATTQLKPAALQVAAEETVRLNIKNTSELSHGLRIAGPDGEYATADDFVSNPEIIPPGGEGFVIMRFDAPGDIKFEDSTTTEATGTIIVGQPKASPAPSQSQGAAADADVSIETTDDAFVPSEINAATGQTLRITLTASSRFAHNIRVAGPDGQYETDDDLVSADVSPGGTGELIVKLDKPGTYKFRCDFHQSIEGTLVVE